MSRAHKGSKRMIAVVAAVVSVCLLLASAAAAHEVLSFANGITATVHTAEEIAGQLESTDKGVSVLVHPAIGSIELQSGGQAAFPYSVAQVEAALGSVRGLSIDLDVEVFLLPSLPVEVQSSYASRDAIFLAPGTGPIADPTAAYIITHELGHVLTWAFLDGRAGRWEQYMQLRGLDPVANGPAAAHADRAREILAEDFRFLFGGAEATASGTIENAGLLRPDLVPGLEDLLAEFAENPVCVAPLARSLAFPNPCNPLTTIEMVAPQAGADPATAVLQVFDLRGALVRTVTGGHLANDRVSLQWDGTADDGRAAASGRYLYLIRLGAVQSRGSVTLVR